MVGLHYLKMLLLFNTIFFSDAGFDYCRVHCPGRVKHTMCTNKAGGGDECKHNKKVYLTTDEKRDILEYHCTLRNKVAAGEEKRGVGGVGQMSAGNMMKLVWNGEIGEFAKRWADQCTGGLHDDCRKAGDGTMVGQNTYIGKFNATNRGNRIDRLIKAIQTWYDEVDHMNAKDAYTFPKDMVDKIGSYTQLVWGETAYIGCGYTEFEETDGNIMFRLVCNYKQLGNIPKGAVYRAGDKPCSTCPVNSICSQTYNALCWKENDFNDWGDNLAQHSPRASWKLALFTVIILCNQ